MQRLATSIPPSAGPMNADARRYRMVVADIDGTLLSERRVLAPAVADAIERARAAGLYFTVATGRRYLTAAPVLQELGLERYGAAPATRGGLLPCVLQTGAVVATADGREVLYRDPMPLADAQRALEVLVELGLQPIVYENDVLRQRLYTGPEAFDTPGARAYLQGNPEHVIRRDYAHLIVHEDPLQLAVIGDRAPLEAAIPRLVLAQCRTILSYSDHLDSYFMEVFHQRCNKGRAASWLAEQLGLSMEQVVCIGDNWNDVEMLAMAGCGIAVGNAAPGVERYARRRAPRNDQDAVALIIDQILAGEEPGTPNPEFDGGHLSAAG